MIRDPRPRTRRHPRRARPDRPRLHATRRSTSTRACPRVSACRSSSRSRPSTRSARSRAAGRGSRSPPWRGRGGSARTGRSSCVSAGNFGQGVAYAARALGIPAVVFTSRHANRGKVERMRALGAEVIEVGEDFDTRAGSVRGVRRRAPGRAPRRRRRPADLDRGRDARPRADRRRRRGRTCPAPVVASVPVGNGALINGVGSWLRAELPGCRVVGVQAEARRGDGPELRGRAARSTPSRPPPTPTGSRPGSPSRARSS